MVLLTQYVLTINAARSGSGWFLCQSWETRLFLGPFSELVPHTFRQGRNRLRRRDSARGPLSQNLMKPPLEAQTVIRWLASQGRVRLPRPWMFASRCVLQSHYYFDRPGEQAQTQLSSPTSTVEAEQRSCQQGGAGKAGILSGTQQPAQS